MKIDLYLILAILIMLFFSVNAAKSPLTTFEIALACVIAFVILLLAVVFPQE